MSDAAWHIFTGEYPPRSGGVGDYSAILAGAIAQAGAEVHIWTGVGDVSVDDGANGVTVHRINGAWSADGLTAVDAELNRQPSPRILLVQYVPNAWGQRGMNRGFCDWVVRRAQAGDEVRVMIHEPFLPYQFSLGPARWYMAWVQRRMLKTLLAAAGTVYLSIQAWSVYIRPFQPRHDQVVTWLPVFSTIPFVADPGRVETFRSAIAKSDQDVVGSFGTYAGVIGTVTAAIFRRLLAETDSTVGLLLGRGSVKLVEQMKAAGNVPADRLFGFEDLAADEASCRLQGCQVMIQPYPDGISSRRSSAMASLAHGIPVVSNFGFLTDRKIREAVAVAASSEFDAQAIADLAAAMLRSYDARWGFGQRGRQLYDDVFAVERTVAKLLGSEPGDRQ